jgi:hypothetical protein
LNTLEKDNTEIAEIEDSKADIIKELKKQNTINNSQSND